MQRAQTALERALGRAEATLGGEQKYNHVHGEGGKFASVEGEATPTDTSPPVAPIAPDVLERMRGEVETAIAALPARYLTEPKQQDEYRSGSDAKTAPIVHIGDIIRNVVEKAVQPAAKRLESASAFFAILKSEANQYQAEKILIARQPALTKLRDEAVALDRQVEHMGDTGYGMSHPKRKIARQKADAAYAVFHAAIAEAQASSDAKHPQLEERYRAGLVAKREAKEAMVTARRNAIHQALSAIRPMGCGGAKAGKDELGRPMQDGPIPLRTVADSVDQSSDTTFNPDNERHPFNDAGGATLSRSRTQYRQDVDDMETALASVHHMYPTDWWSQMHERAGRNVWDAEGHPAPPSIVVGRSSGRGYTDPMWPMVMLSTRERDVTSEGMPTQAVADQHAAIHEWGHMMEHEVPGLNRLMEGFLNERTHGDRDEPMGAGWGDDERTTPDHLADRYMGIRYEDGATELLSMGMEDLWGGQFATPEKDPEHYSLLLGALAALPLQKRKRKSYNPQERRDPHGQWTREGGPSSLPGVAEAVPAPSVELDDPTEADEARYHRVALKVQGLFEDFKRGRQIIGRYSEFEWHERDAEAMEGAGRLILDSMLRPVAATEQKIAKLRRTIDRTGKAKEKAWKTLTTIRSGPEFAAVREEARSVMSRTDMDDRKYRTMMTSGFPNETTNYLSQLEKRADQIDVAHPGWSRRLNELVSKLGPSESDYESLDADWSDAVHEQNQLILGERKLNMRKAYLGQMGAIRSLGWTEPLPMRPVTKKLKDPAGATHDPELEAKQVGKAIATVQDLYPTDWHQAMHQHFTDRPPLQVGYDLSKDPEKITASHSGHPDEEGIRYHGRGYMNQHGSGILMLSGEADKWEGQTDSVWILNEKDDQRVAAHELGHWMEAVVPLLHDATKEFLYKRTKDETAQRMMDLHPDCGYLPDEMTKPDKLTHPYMGKDYGDNSELISTAFEDLQHGHYDIAQHDPQHMHHFLGAVAFLGRPGVRGTERPTDAERVAGQEFRYGHQKLRQALDVEREKHYERWKNGEITEKEYFKIQKEIERHWETRTPLPPGWKPKKSADGPTEQKFNPNHDAAGRFSSADGGGAALNEDVAGASAVAPTNRAPTTDVVLDDRPLRDQLEPYRMDDPTLGPKDKVERARAAGNLVWQAVQKRIDPDRVRRHAEMYRKWEQKSAELIDIAKQMKEIERQPEFEAMRVSARAADVAIWDKMAAVNEAEPDENAADPFHEKQAAAMAELRQQSATVWTDYDAKLMAAQQNSPHGDLMQRNAETVILAHHLFGKAEEVLRAMQVDQHHAVMQVLGELRPMGAKLAGQHGMVKLESAHPGGIAGGKPLDGGKANAEVADMQQALEYTHALYPTDWWEEAGGHRGPSMAGWDPTVSTGRAPGGRAHTVFTVYNEERREFGATVYLGGSSDTDVETAREDRRTAAHEWGHMMENGVPGLGAVVRRFLQDRTAGETQRHMAGPGYNADEVTKRDRLANDYIGRQYPDGSTEVLSTGMEFLWGMGSEERTARYDLPTLDPDHLHFVLGLLACYKKSKTSGKSFDTLERALWRMEWAVGLKFNPNHDATGKFASAEGEGEAPPPASLRDRLKDNVELMQSAKTPDEIIDIAVDAGQIVLAEVRNRMGVGEDSQSAKLNQKLADSVRKSQAAFEDVQKDPEVVALRLEVDQSEKEMWRVGLQYGADENGSGIGPADPAEHAAWEKQTEGLMDKWSDGSMRLLGLIHAKRDAQQESIRDSGFMAHLLESLDRQPDTRKQAILGALAEVRPMGAETPPKLGTITDPVLMRQMLTSDEWGASTKQLSDMNRSTSTISGLYPADWWHHIGDVQTGRSQTGRGGSVPNQNLILLGSPMKQGDVQSEEDDNVAAHEWGHMMEGKVPGLSSVMQRFRERRTKGEQATPIPGRPNETCLRDNWTDPYMGRYYAAHPEDTELFSTAMEDIWSDRYSIDRHDEEHLSLVLGLLAIYGRKKKT